MTENPPVVLSLFPGADLLGMAFEQEGFCVVRGPDVLLGGDVRSFHVPPDKFDGVIGGPPCQPFSQAVKGHAPSENNLIPEFERIVEEAQPRWFVMEEVKEAPLPFTTAGASRTDCQLHVAPKAFVSLRGALYEVLIDAWWYGAHQHRSRRFTSNLPLNTVTSTLAVDSRDPDPWPTITATEQKYCGGTTDRRRAGRKVGRQMTLEEINIGMGLPADWSTPALTKEMSYKVRGNGVPLQLGRAIARAVKEALHQTERKAA